MGGKMDEKILCFSAAVLDQLGRFQGISFEVEKYFPSIVTRPYCHYLLRGRAENDPSEKQIIPYALFVHEDTIFSYRRGKSGSESRLRELYSVGVGGHIKMEDSNPLFSERVGYEAYEDAVKREVSEEVKIDSPCTQSCVALINDDSNEVGQVHFGVVHIFKLADSGIAKKETKITEASLVPVELAVRNLDEYETWSQLCLRQIEQLLIRSASAVSGI